MVRESIYDQLRVHCAPLWSRCRFELSGDGWFNVLSALTHTIKTTIAHSRSQRCSALRYNLALRRAVGGGNTWPLYKFLWDSDHADISTIGQRIEKGAIKMAEERQQRVAALIANPQFRDVPLAESWPRFIRATETGYIEQPLLIETLNAPDSTISALLLLTRNLCGNTCKSCGSSFEPKSGILSRKLWNIPQWRVALCRLCVLETEHRIDFDEDVHWPPKAEDL